MGKGENAQIQIQKQIQVAHVPLGHPAPHPGGDPTDAERVSVLQQQPEHQRLAGCHDSGSFYAECNFDQFIWKVELVLSR